jgi:hypothetical protein
MVGVKEKGSDSPRSAGCFCAALDDTTVEHRLDYPEPQAWTGGRCR